MWNLFTVGSLQFLNDSTIASMEANQNRPKTLGHKMSAQSAGPLGFVLS